MRAKQEKIELGEISPEKSCGNDHDGNCLNDEGQDFFKDENPGQLDDDKCHDEVQTAPDCDGDCDHEIDETIHDREEGFAAKPKVNRKPRRCDGCHELEGEGVNFRACVICLRVFEDSKAFKLTSRIRFESNVG